MTDRPVALAGIPLLEDLGPLKGAKVLVRTDFNVPLHQCHDTGGYKVADDFRIRMAIPTLRWLQEQGAQVTAMSHLGRPAGQPDAQWDMAPVRKRLEELCPGVALLDNLRFDPGEKKNDPAFVARLIDGFDAYVDEAFGVAHRSDASIVGPPQFLPAAAGIELAREVEVLGGLLHSPARPFVAVVGGAKVADKLGVLRSLAERVDLLVVGGAMAFSFLVGLGHDVGSSLVDEDRIAECRALFDSEVALVLPTDVVALEPGGNFGPEDCIPEPCGATKVFDQDLPPGWMGLDIGPISAKTFAEHVATAGTVLWNGPMGAFEDERFAGGTKAVAEAVANCEGFTVVGGGDSAAALDCMGLADQVDFLSTGGGASLKFLEDGDLPALQALRGAANAPTA